MFLTEMKNWSDTGNKGKKDTRKGRGSSADFSHLFPILLFSCNSCLLGAADRLADKQ